MAVHSSEGEDNWKKLKAGKTMTLNGKLCTIIAYFVEGMGWISKATGISLARKGQIDAVVARCSGRNLYLRTRPDKNISNNLEAMG